MIRRIVSPIICLLVSTLPVVAQIDDKTAEVVKQNSASVVGIINLCYTLGTICGLIGAMLTYAKIQDGQTDSYGAIKNWFVACLALLILPQLAAAIMNAYVP